MAVNKYGNDFKNNIMWNKEYPFIPEITNDYGFTIHENDVVDYYDKYDEKFHVLRVAKIYNKEHVWCREKIPKETKWQGDRMHNANELLPHTSNGEPPKIYDYDNQGVWNHLEDILGQIYSDIYPTELNAPDDWHFDDDLFDARRLEEVEKIKSKR